MFSFFKKRDKKETSTRLSLVIWFYFVFTVSEKEETQMVIQHWTRTVNTKLGWIHDFDKLVVDYATTVFIFDTFCSSSGLVRVSHGHTFCVSSIDFLTFDDCQLLCSGSFDKTVSVWDVEAKKQIQSFNRHSSYVSCVKFSSYHYYHHRHQVVCFSSSDNNIRFGNVKNNRKLQVVKGHTNEVTGIEFSPFNGGQYLCSGSCDYTIRLWDVKTYNTAHTFNGHANVVLCVDFSSLQSNNNSNKSNIIGVIGETQQFRIWDIETTKQLTVFKGHDNDVTSVKYGSNTIGNNGAANTILSGSNDSSVRLWDIRSDQQIQTFNGHTDYVNAVEYSPFVLKNNEIGSNSNVICSGSSDMTIRFWDIRSNKKELHVLEGDGDGEIHCLKFLKLRKKRESNYDRGCDIYLSYEGEYLSQVQFSLILILFNIVFTLKKNKSSDRINVLANVKHIKRQMCYYKKKLIVKRQINNICYKSDFVIVIEKCPIITLSINFPREVKKNFKKPFPQAKVATQATSILSFETLGSLPHPIFQGQCLRYNSEILICGGFEERNCYSYHILKNEYKTIHYYPNNVELQGHCVLKWSKNKNDEHTNKSEDIIKIKKTRFTNKWLPLIDNNNNKVYIGRKKDNYDGMRAVIGGKKNNLLFITYYPNNIDVFNLNTYRYINHSILPTDYNIHHHCFIKNNENNEMLLFYISNKIYKYIISEERCLTIEQTLPIPLSCCVATLNDNFVHILDGYYNDFHCSIHIKTNIKEIVEINKEKERQKIAEEEEKITIEQMKEANSNFQIKMLNRKKKEIKTILEHWNRILSVKIGWINDFSTIISKYILLKYFRLLRVINYEGKYLKTVKFSPDGRTFVRTSEENIIQIWDVSSANEVNTKELKGHFERVCEAQFSPDGTMIISCSNDKTIRLWDVKSGIEVKKLEGHTDNVRTVQFSSDGMIIVSASNDNTIRVWDIQSGQEIQILNNLTDVQSITFSPNGQQIIILRQDSTILIIDIKSGEETNINYHNFSIISNPSSGQLKYGM
ncbi:WD repeat-containing protein [Reticulomyxa filosa]|uniref:WD repeat-containing protein n=1 Tax=Reticulomyxa filosa TaxID=46433 RepID=X6P267_RETFI|nr:WD repeat-containing protein [Reticulomyxa filosa]|eukprot:ETO32164.1 WD repeat-containing protein [Reticulomyxa filosa]